MEMVEIPIVDLRRKEIGKLLLTKEAVEILEATGVDLIMRYNSKTPEVTGWLD